MLKENYYKKSYRELLKTHWKYQSIYIRLRDKGVCYTCGIQKEIGEMFAGHFNHNGKSKSFWKNNDERNLRCQCYQCNEIKSGALNIYGAKLVRQYGSKILDELNALSWKSEVPTQDEMIDAIFALKDKIKILQNKNGIYNTKASS